MSDDKYNVRAANVVFWTPNLVFGTSYVVFGTTNLVFGTSYVVFGTPKCSAWEVGTSYVVFGTPKFCFWNTHKIVEDTKCGARDTKCT